MEGLLTSRNTLVPNLIPKFESSNSNMRSRSLDSLLSLLAGFAGGLAVWAIRNWVLKQQAKNKKNSKSNYPCYNNGKYNKNSDYEVELVQHNGACHCKRVKFRIRAPRLLQAVDIPSKIRFPRMTVPISSFEALTDDTIMSHYAVKFGKEIGIHTFCSYCGVHVVFAPSINPSEVLVNIHCIDKSDVDDEYITYYNGMEANSPSPMSHDEASRINKSGKGMINIPGGHSPCADGDNIGSWVRPGLYTDTDAEADPADHSMDIIDVDKWTYHQYLWETRLLV